MTKLMIAFLLMFVPSLSFTAPKVTTAEKIYRLSPPTLSKPEIRQVAHMIDLNAKKYNIDPEVFVSIIKTESNFDQTVVSPSGDISMAQINVTVWNKEFKRLGMEKIDYKRLKHDSGYAINTMGKILNIVKHRYAKHDPKWYARYHSSSQKNKQVYYSKLVHHKRTIAMSSRRSF